jgi:hypothetical protein
MISQAAVIHVGTPQPGYNEVVIPLNEGWVMSTVHIPGFASLSTSYVVYSPEFDSFGNQWRLWIYPGGSENISRRNGVPLPLE